MIEGKPGDQAPSGDALGGIADYTLEFPAIYLISVIVFECFDQMIPQSKQLDDGSAD